MYKSSKSYIIAVFVGMLFVLPKTFAQTTPVTHLPYNCTFEDANENTNWVFAFTSWAGTNRWCIGTAAPRSGQYGMYVSDDGGKSAKYSESPTQSPSGYYIVAYREFALAPGTYDLSFNWKSLGGADIYDVIQDAFAVAWMPDTVAPLAPGSWGNFPGEVATYPVQFTTPPYPAPLPNPPYIVFRGSAAWNTAIAKITVDNKPNIHKYRLVFVWKANGDAIVKQPGACIDNVQVGVPFTNCAAKPKNITTPNVINSASNIPMTWSGTADSYDIEYFMNGNSAIYTDKVISDTTYNMNATGLPEGVYTFRVRSICNGDTSIFVDKNNIVIYDPTLHCLDYLNLTNSNCWIGVNVGDGTPANPKQQNKKVDNRHTVNYMQGATDPNTANLLTTIPDGAVASIRLGNWNTGAEAEAIEYKYKVDASKTGILLLKYAAVMQDPGHIANHQPKMRIDILDAKGNDLTPKCTSAEFIAGHSTTGPSWHTVIGSTSVLWKDWTTIGFNLQPYDGQTLTIRLATYDCSETGHYGYGYFTLDCKDGHIYGASSCGEKPAQFSVIEGFKYRWYYKYPSPYHPGPDKTLGNSNIYPTSGIITQNDTAMYCVDVMQPEDTTCYYTLTASAMGRLPRARAIFESAPSNCENRIKITNKSTIYGYYNSNKDSVDLHQDCDTYTWDFGNGTILHGKNPNGGYVSFPNLNQGGTVTCNLRVTMGSSCYNDTTITFDLPPIKPDTLRDSKYVSLQDFSPTNTYTYNGKTYALSDIKWDGSNPVGIGTDTIFRKTVAGCDSLLISILKVLKEPVPIDEGDTVVCSNSFKYHNNTFTQSGICRDTIPSKVLPADSIIYKINLILNIPFSVKPDTISEICADAPQMSIPYLLKVGTSKKYHYTLEFEPSAFPLVAGDISAAADLSSSIDVPLPANIRPDKYKVILKFTDDVCQMTTVDTLKFSIYYSSSVVEQKWNDVLAVKNQYYNNGIYEGYTFSGFKWYLNNDSVPINGEIKSYYYLGGGKTFNNSDYYRVGLQRDGEDYYILSCPITTVTRVNTITVYPTIVSYNQPVTITFGAKTLQVRVYDSMGLIIKTATISGGTAKMALPAQRGVYLLELTDTATGAKETKRIIVQ